MITPGSAFSVDVTINGNVTHQMMEGFGSTIRVFDDPHVFNNFNGTTRRANTTMTRAQEDEILDLLYVDLGLTRVRPATDRAPDGGSIEPINDNNDPNVTDLEQFNFAWKNNDAFIDLVKRLRSRGLTTYFLSPIEIETWMTEDNPEEYVEWAMAIIRTWRDAEVELPFYSIMNEPGYTRGREWTGAYLRDVIKSLGQKLEAEGFATRIIAPDDLNARTARERLDVIMADPDAAKYVSAFGYHLYGNWPEDKQRIKTMSLENNIPIWMTEWSAVGSVAASATAWVNAIHDQINEYNVSAVDHMWGFFGEWEPPSTHFVSLLYTGATYTGYRLNKNYYLTGQYSRYVKPGFRRIDVESTSTSIRCTAYTNASDFVQVCANRGNTAQTVQVNLSGVSNFTELRAIRTAYTGEENWAELSPVAVENSNFSVTLPATSVTTYIYNYQGNFPSPPTGVNLKKT